MIYYLNIKPNVNNIFFEFMINPQDNLFVCRTVAIVLKLIFTNYLYFS